MAQNDNPLEAFRQVLAGAARAIAREPELELAYTAEQPSAQGKSVKVPMPGRTLPEREVAEARGYADAAALKLRHHNAALHARAAPADEIARAVFDAAEQARVEGLGARSMAGVRANLSRAVEMRMRTDPITRARSRAEVPLDTAVGLVVRERLTGEAPPEGARAGLDFVADWIEEKAGADLDALGLAIDDQAAFAALATRLLRDLELVEGDLVPDPDQGEQGEGGDEAEGEDSDKDSDEDAEGGDSDAELRVEQGESAEDEAEGEYDDQELGEADDGLGGEGGGGRMRGRPNRPLSALPPQFDNPPFPPKYNRIIEPPGLCADQDPGRP